MKAFHTAAAVAIGMATLCSTLQAQSTAFPQSLREQRFVRSIGVTPGTRVIYANAKGHKIAFPQFKHEIDESGSFKIAKQGFNGELTVMQVATRTIEKHS